MGMFDTVIYEAPCMNCGKMLTNFQTKDAFQELETMSPGVLAKFGGLLAHFYEPCPKCQVWNEYTFGEYGAVIAAGDWHEHPYNKGKHNDS